MSEVAAPAQLSDSEIAELLHEVESKHDLFAPTIEGISAWQLLRAPVARALRRSVSRSVAGPQAQSRSELVRRSAADWARYVRLPRAPVLVKSFVSGLAELQDDGRYRDVFFDDVLDAVGPHVKLEIQNAPPRPGGWAAAHLPPNASTVGTDFVAHVLARLRPSREVSELAASLGEAISTEFHIVSFGRDEVARRLDTFRWGKRLYGRVLDRVLPQSVLVADTGEFELFAAARERGVKCIELQHGIFTRTHPDALGAAAAAHRDRLIVPDVLALFGAYWEDDLRAGGFYGAELRAVGSPRIDRFRERRASLRRADQRVCRVLVTSGGLATNELAGIIAETAALAGAEGFDCRFDVKLHPIYDLASAETYATGLAGAGEVRILTSEQRPSTLELLSEADAHVSISSTCHYESLALGVPTIIVRLLGYETVQPLIDAGHAPLAASPAELLAHLREAKETHVPEDVSTGYYRPGALARIAGELDHAVERGKRT